MSQSYLQLQIHQCQQCQQPCETVVFGYQADSQVRIVGQSCEACDTWLPVEKSMSDYIAEYQKNSHQTAFV